jgi:hypothetical protein
MTIGAILSNETVQKIAKADPYGILGILSAITKKKTSLSSLNPITAIENMYKAATSPDQVTVTKSASAKIKAVSSGKKKKANKKANKVLRHKTTKSRTKTRKVKGKKVSKKSKH